MIPSSRASYAATSRLLPLTEAPFAEASEKAAEEWGVEQEALIRRNLWLDPRDGETRFEIFVEESLDAVSSRLEGNMVAKYRSLLDNHLLPQWGVAAGWDLQRYVGIKKWDSELHEDYAESTVATISTFMTAAVRARKIPANPCHGVRVTSGEYEFDKFVASPVQILAGSRCA
ncbi:hypothetical protein GCM10009754_64760 [Amycolatopsis minnesotensis]|uniref:Uncharacterized protein n=1 Tax=Amycolatopsis minnesotensis TaxID=337894 RepID=A0ABN2S3S8_9PSEU